MKYFSTRDKFIFYNIPVFLFSLLPFFLITGPFLSDLSISIISLLFIYYCYKIKNFSFFKNKFFYFFILFWIYILINSLINNFNLDSLKISFFYFRYGIFVIALIALFEADDSFLKFFFYSIFLCFLALILDGYYQYFVGENLLGWKNLNGFRVSSFFGDELILGSYLSRLWPIFFGLSILFFKKRNKFFFLLMLIFILSEVLIFLSGERVAFFYINLSAIFVIIFSNNLLKLRLITLLSSLLLILFISYFSPSSKERIIDQTLSQMNLAQDEKNEHGIYIFSKQHNEHYISAIKIFLDNKILGVGVKNFRIFCDHEDYKSKYSCSTHPHNTYIQILSETGLIGFFFIFSVLFYFCKYIFRHLILKFRNDYYFNDFEICLMSGIIIFLWPFVPTGNIFNNWLNIIMYLYLPLLFWSKGLMRKI